MGGFDEHFKKRLERNGFSMYSIGIAIILLRFYAQLRKNGIRGLEADDYLMVLVIFWYSLLIATLYTIVEGGGSNLALPEEYATFTPEEIQDRIFGSKIVVLSEQAMLNMIYTLKACLLVLYARLTQGTQHLKLVKGLATYVAIGFIATEIGFFSFCRPFIGYWAVPPPDPQCTTLEYYTINQGAWNVSSDLMMLCIPLPMLAKLKMPLKQKIILGLVFTLGAYVILAAVLTKAFNLSNVYDPSYMLWYIREASVAVYVANLPIIWPMLREWFPYLRNAKLPTLPLSTYESLNSSGKAKKRFSKQRFSWRRSGHDHRKSTVTSTITGPMSQNERRPASAVVSMHPTAPRGKLSRSPLAEEIGTIGLERITSPSNGLVSPKTPLSRSGSRRDPEKWDTWTVNVDTTFDMKSNVDLTEDGQVPSRSNSVRRKEIVSSIGKAKVRRV